ncbi:MAG: fibronectin type III domain-containing protein, partial [Candidatus ainarchaeum sp.]|nr:fibronectin type III domain-containing protein [Candidatus ainarchaeum sp.]
PDSSKWYNSSQAYVSWPDENASYYAYAYDSKPDTIPGNSSTTKLRSLSLPAKQSGVYYFHINAVDFSGKSSVTSHFKIQIDTDGPTRPVVTVAPLDNGLKVEWTPSEDSLSGIKGYEVYRNRLTNFNIRDLGVKKLGIFTDTSIIDSNDLEEGKTFFYKVAPLDNAGNRGLVSAQAQGTTKSICTLGISLTAALTPKKDAIAVKISAQNLIYFSSLSVQLPDGNSFYLFKDKSAYTSWDGNMPVSNTNQGRISFQMTAREFYGDICDMNQAFVFDILPPTLEFVFPKNYREEINSVVKIRLSAGDAGDFKSGIKEVDVSYDRNGSRFSIGKAVDANGYYAIDWNTETVPNGYYVLNAVAVDNTNNQTEKTKAVFVFNTLGLTADANMLINSALDQLRLLDSKAKLLSKFGAESQALSDSISEGMSEIETARQQANDRQFDAAKASARRAKESFSKAQAVDLNVISSSQFVFNKQQAQILLEAARLPPETVKNAVFLIKQSDVSRSLDVLKVKDGNNVFYKVAISIVFNFPRGFLQDNNINSLNIIEIIPKEFSESASNIYSEQAFDTVVQDPEISFALDANFFKPKATLVYSLKDSFEEESAAMKFVTASTVNKFIAPPVILASGYDAGVVPADVLPWIVLLAALAIVLLALVALAFLMLRKKGFGKLKKKWYK